MRKIAFASGIGTMIEYYDYTIFGAAAALVFPTVFFPALGATAGIVASFATLAVVFFARPVGSLIFGHFGDRLGRKKTLLWTLMLMGVATVLVGLTPSAAQIGVAAPIIVVVLRFIQGLAVGGEWTGAVLLATENAPTARRGLWSIFPTLGSVIGAALATATFLVTGLTMSEEIFLSYGWRIPFIASLVMLGIGLYVRLAVDETPAFKAEVARGGTAKAPFIESFRQQPREMALASGAMLMVFAFVFVGLVYLITYGTVTLNYSRTSVLLASLIAAPAFAAGTIAGASVSDRIGRLKVIAGANAIGVIWSLALFPIADAGFVGLIVAMCVTVFVAGLSYGTAGAFLTEIFPTRYRYTATAFTYNVAGVFGGAVISVVSAPIIAAYGTFTFGVLLALLCLLGLGCTLGLRETRHVTMDR
jgi:MFS family permease